MSSSRLRHVKTRAKNLTPSKTKTPPTRTGTLAATGESIVSASRQANCLRNQEVYKKLKFMLAGTVVGTTVDQLDLKLKGIQSDPCMKELLCRYKYEKILEVARALVAKGDFEIDQGSSLSYLSACKAVKRAQRNAEKEDDRGESSGSGKNNTITMLQSTASEPNPPTTSSITRSVATSDTAVKPFDSLLQEHLEASKSPSTTPAVLPSLKPVKAAENVSSEQLPGEAKLNAEPVEAVDNPIQRIKAPLKDDRGVYYEKYLQKVYQILKPDLKDFDCRSRGGFQRLRRKINEIAGSNHKLEEVCQQHGVYEVFNISYWLAFRGLFLVDYVKFPRFHEAAVEASKLFPGHTTRWTRSNYDASDEVAAMAKSQSANLRIFSDLESSDTIKTSEPSVMVTEHDHSTGASIPALLETENANEASKELPPAAPWESIRIPNMHEIKPSTSRDTIPEFWKMKFFEAQEKPEIMHNIDRVHDAIASSMAYAHIRLPSMQELEPSLDQDSELNVNGLRLLDFEPPEIPAPALVPDLSEPISPGEAEVVTDEQYYKPSKVLFSSGIGRGINIKHLFKAFADVSPVNIDLDASKRLAIVTFSDVEAATKALQAKHGTFLSGRALNCEFGSESSLNDQVSIHMVALEKPTDDHKDSASLISGETVTNERYDTPSQWLFVGNIGRRVNIKQLFEKFADVSPIDIRFTASWPFAFIEFADVEHATKALKAKNGTLLHGRTLTCKFSTSQDSPQKSSNIRTIASGRPVDDHMGDLSSKSEFPEAEDVVAVRTTTTTDTVAEGSEKLMKESVGEVPTDNTAKVARYSPTEIIVEELSLPSKPVQPDQTTSLVEKVPGRQRKGKKAKASQPITKEPAPSSETRSDKSVVEMSSPPTEERAEATTMEPRSAEAYENFLNDDDAIPETIKGSSTDQTMSNDLETDDNISPVESKWNRYVADVLKKSREVDHVLPEISRHATMPVPQTHAFFLPHSSQNRVLCGLQISLEQVCFRYLQRKQPDLLRDTSKRWGIDHAHALELNGYMSLLSTLGVFNAGVLSGPRGSQSLQALNRSMIALRNKAVHRIRVDIHALRFWALSAVRLAKLLEDHEAAKQFSSLLSALEVEHDRMKVEKSKAEESLLTTVKDLAAKRAELDRVEQEAMTAYEAAHKQLPARTSELGMSIDANIPLDYGFGFESKETSSAKPTSGVFGRIKSWFGA